MKIHILALNQPLWVCGRTIFLPFFFKSSLLDLYVMESIIKMKKIEKNYQNYQNDQKDHDDQDVEHVDYVEHVFSSLD